MRYSVTQIRKWCVIIYRKLVYHTPRGFTDTRVHVYPVLIGTLKSTLEKYL